MAIDSTIILEVANIKKRNYITTLARDIANEISQVLKFEGEIIAPGPLFTRFPQINFPKLVPYWNKAVIRQVAGSNPAGPTFFPYFSP